MQATDFTVNGTPANSFVLSNGNAHDYFPLQQLAGDDPRLQQAMHIPAGAFNRASDNDAELRIQLFVLLRPNAATGDYD